MTLLITGASGRLGRELAKLFPDSLTPTHQELDITLRDKVNDYIARNGVASIIHCAALTSVRSCEGSRDKAFSVNVIGTKNLVDGLTWVYPRNDSYFLYLSTACVFPGDALEKYYTENDLPYPKNYYALTKLLGEVHVQKRDPYISTLIVRTNFIEHGPWAYPQAFEDRFANYLYSDECAKKITQLYEEREKGIIHVVGDVRMSMYEWARLEDPDVRNTSLSFYHGPPLTVNMCLGTVYNFAFKGLASKIAQPSIPSATKKEATAT